MLNQTIIESTCENQFTTIGADVKLSLTDAINVARKAHKLAVHPSTYPIIQRSFNFLKNQIDQRVPIYGINTNFGDQVNYVDAQHKSEDKIYHHAINVRQENIIKSLACSLGTEVDPEIIKVTMLLRAHCLSQGYSGVHPQAIDAIIDFMNAGITPIVHCYGSIGASGDLIPLGCIAAGIIGADVPVYYCNEKMSAQQALDQAGLKKFKPQLRDGLAMINGTSFMTAIASLATYDLQRLFKQMLLAIGMTLESMQVNSSAYHPLVHQVKKQAGEIFVADYLMNFWQGSRLVQDLQQANTLPKQTTRIQDYYSLRAIAQGFGPFYENLNQATQWIENEMNSVNDNPIIDVAAAEVLHSANFMGYYITDACDMLKMDISQASTWVHALLANLVHSRKNNNLPTNIVNNPGKNNGFRSMQLLAAALTVQNRKLAQSQQAFMIPTEGDNQDVNSLGTHAALDLRESVANLERLTAILFLAAAQALEFRGIEFASEKAQNIFNAIRDISPTIEDCRPMTAEINQIIMLLRSEVF